jgi:putative ABC transport system permease protein
MRLLTELRHAVRRLARRPLLTALAIATLAIGIGVNTAVFSLLEGAVLRELPLPDPDRVTFVREIDPDGSSSNLGFATYVDLAERATSFERMAVSSLRRPVLGGEGDAETLDALGVSASWLPTLGVVPLLGRNLTAEEDRPGAPRVALLSHALWQRRFGGDPGIVGRTVALSEIPHEVVGVLPPALDQLMGPGPGRRLDLIVPLRYGVEQPWACRTCRHLNAIGRLEPHVEPAAASAELDSLFAALQAAYPKEYPTPRGAVEPMRERLAERSKPLLTALFGGVVLVLLLAVANVAALLAVRAVERQRELSIRRSLGADRRSLLLSAWSESAVLAGAGGAAGLAVAGPLLRLFAAAAPPDLARLGTIELAFPVLAFVAGTSVVAALAAGVAPALVHLRSSARDVLAATSTAGAARGRRNAVGRLVVIELALALVVVFAAALVGRSLERLLAEDPGFRVEQVTTATVSLVGNRYDDDPAAHALFEQAAARLAAMPGIEAAGWTSQLPLGGNFDSYTLRFETRPEMRLDEEPAADRYAVTPGYFRALGLRLVAGRLLESADDADGELAVVINRSLAESIWPDQDPLGKRLRMSAEDAPWRTVVGVVDDVRHQGLDRPSTAQFYVPAEQWFFADNERVLVVRSNLPPAAVAARLAPVIHELDPNLPVEGIRTMERVLDESAGGRRFAAGVWSSFAALALVLAAIGTYGLLSRQVALRRRELGVRSALGAAPGRLRRDVVLGAAALATAAVAIALPLCFVAGRLLRSQLWRVPEADPVSLVIAVGVVAAMAAAASLPPARRAARVDPATVLRDE